MSELCLILAAVCFAAAILGAWLGLRDFDPLNERRDDD